VKFAVCAGRGRITSLQPRESPCSGPLVRWETKLKAFTDQRNIEIERETGRHYVAKLSLRVS
jgi:hypothetical protein